MTNLTKSTSKGCCASFIISYFITSIGISFIFAGIFLVIDLKNRVNWPTVEGKIITSAIEEHKSKRTGRITYEAVVCYEYKVNNVLHYGNTVSYNDRLSKIVKYNTDIVNKYPKGSIVTIHYNPNKPHVAVLETDIKSNMWHLSIIGVIFLIAGLYMSGLFSSIKMKQPELPTMNPPILK